MLGAYLSKHGAGAAPCVPQHLALGQVLQDLLDDPDALLYLAYPHPVRSLDVARLVGDHVEVHVRVPAVRVIPAHVEAYPGAAQGRDRKSTRLNSSHANTSY